MVRALTQADRAALADFMAHWGSSQMEFGNLLRWAVDVVKPRYAAAQEHDEATHVG